MEDNESLRILPRGKWKIMKVDSDLGDRSFSWWESSVFECAGTSSGWCEGDRRYG